MPEDESSDKDRSNIEFPLNNKEVSRELDFTTLKKGCRKSENFSNPSPNNSSYDSYDDDSSDDDEDEE